MLSSDSVPRNEEENEEETDWFLDDPDEVHCVGLIHDGKRCLAYGCYQVMRHKGAE